MRRLSTAAILASAASLLAACPAAAATRYASSTGGTEEPCASTVPCTLAWAVQHAKEGDEVIVLPGPAYSITKGIETSVALNVHGPAEGPLPELDYASSEMPSGPVLGLRSGSSISRLHIVGTHAGDELLFVPYSGVADDLLIEAKASKQTLAILPGGSVLRDSVLESGLEAEELIGVSNPNIGSSTTSFLRNATVELPGSGAVAVQAAGRCFPEIFPELHCDESFSSSPEIDIANSLLRGAALDLNATQVQLFSKTYLGHIKISHSNYRAGKVHEDVAKEITDIGGNQTSLEPSLTSDYHELASSVTIDAGLSDAHVGAVDFDGNPRLLGSAPDIGAFEFVPPIVPGGAGSAGESAAARSGGESAPGGGSAAGAGHAVAGAARASGKAVVERLSCTGAAGQTCRVGITLTSSEHLHGSRVVGVTANVVPATYAAHAARVRRVTVGALAVTLHAPQSQTVKVPLNVAGRRLLARRHRLPLTARTVSRDQAGKSTRIALATLTLRSKRRRR
jgi:hypothetical protein